MLAMMAPVLESLERSVAKRIDLHIYCRYPNAQNALVVGDVDIMRVGPATYIEAKRRNPGISLLLAQNGRVRGCIFVNGQSGIHSLADLKGKSIAFVEDSSTTGNYLPKVKLLQAGLTARDLRGGGTNFLGSHDKVARAVAANRFDAGAANASVVEPFLQKSGGTLRVLLELKEDYMGLPWVASQNVAPEVAATIRAGLQSIRDKATLQGLGNNTSGFTQARDEDFDTLREQMREAEGFDGVRAKPAGAP
jgi:phosphonate transport system substrate-binding protein